MPTKRDVLEHLKRDELLAAVDRHDLTVRDRRVRGELVEALAGSRRAPLPEILDELPRTRLKEICRDLGLDDSGREKAVIIERLAGRSPHPPAPSPASPLPSPGEGGTSSVTKGKTRGHRTPLPSRHPEGSPSDPKDLGGGPKLTRDALERHLWAAADILRGSIDSSDYKNYILGLLFLKRLSDRFEEECEAVRAAGYDPDDPHEHQFFVPPRARWPELRKVTTDVGRALNKAAEALEEANPSLEGVLAGIDFNDERRLGDVRQRDTILSQLLLHFSEIDLRNANLSEPDMLGRAYEYLIERFADDAGKKGGEFYTPHQVVKLMVEILAPQEGMRICDPTCGSGGLIQCAKYVERHGGDPRNLSLYGQEKNLGTWAICKMNMLLHGLPDATIYKGDTIRDPRAQVGGELMLFDLVIANPPFSLDNWGREVAEHDSFGRFRLGIPPKSKGDLAFVQHMIATLNDHGRMAVVMPHGVLFRGGSEEEIRKGIVDADLLEAVIGLAPDLFYGTNASVAILVINKSKPPERRGKVLFAHGSRDSRGISKQKTLRDEDITRITSTLRTPRDLHSYSRSVDLTEIREKRYGLNINQYLKTPTKDSASNLEEALTRLREAEFARDSSRLEMEELLQEVAKDWLALGITRRESGTQHTEPSELPESWPYVVLSEVATLQTGIAKGKEPGSNAVEVPYLRVANVQDGFLDLEEVKTIRVEPSALERYRLRSGDVLFTEGGDRDKLGRGCVWNGEIDPCLHQNHVFVARPDPDRLLPKFLSLYGASPRGKAYFLECAKQTTNLASINSSQLKAMPVPLPSIEVQRRIAACVSSIEKNSVAEQEVLQNLRVLKSALSAALLSGEIRVTPDSEPEPAASAP